MSDDLAIPFFLDRRNWHGGHMPKTEPSSAFIDDSMGDMLIDGAAADTLKGDIRDALLTHVRSIKVPWAMLAEDEQGDAIKAITSTAEHAIRQIAHLIAQRGFPHVGVMLGKWTVNEGIKLECNAQGSIENITRLAEHGARGAVLVLSDIGDFLGQRAEASPDKNQPDLPLDKAA